MNHNLLVGQSGGPTAVINGSLYGVVSEGLANPEIDNVIGMVNGIEGFLADHTIDMAPLKENGELERIRTTPGSYLGSCRYKLPEDLSDPVYPELFQKFTEKEISYFFYIGGNDSMDTVSKLSRYAATVGSNIRIIGVPKTIDNDLVLTDHTRATEVLPNMLLLQYAKLQLMPLSMIINHLSPSSRSWDAMPDG